MDDETVDSIISYRNYICDTYEHLLRTKVLADVDEMHRDVLVARLGEAYRACISEQRTVQELETTAALLEAVINDYERRGWMQDGWMQDSSTQRFTNDYEGV